MQSPLLFYGYAGLALIGATYLTFRSRPQRKFLGIMFAFWILGGSIIHLGMFDLPLKALGGNLQIRQLSVIIAALYFVIASLIGLPRTGNHKPWAFEKYYLLFGVAFLSVCIYHLGEGMLEIRDIRAFTEGTILVMLMYLLLRRYADSGLVDTIVNAIIVVGVIATVVSIIQFFISQNFLRIGSSWLAFGGRLRSNGIYNTEYLNSFSLIGSALTALFWVQKKNLRITLLSLYGVGLLLTFHRMSWLAAMITAFLYVLLTGRVRSRKLVLTSLFAAGLLVVITLAVFPSVVEDAQQTDIFRSRISRDTMTDRLKFFGMVLDNFDKVAVLGAGSKKNSLYYYGMLGTGVGGREWALGQRGGIHNGYLEHLFFYGLPILILHCVLLLKTVWEFYKKAIKGYDLQFVPFFLLVVFMCMNLTNALAWDSSYGNLLAIILGISVKSVFTQNDPPMRTPHPVKS